MGGADEERVDEMASTANSEFRRLLRSDNDPTLTVYDFRHEDGRYILTDGTGEGVFVYDAFEVEQWADQFNQYGASEGFTAYDDFCQSVDAVTDLDVVRAAYEATGLIACRAGSCEPLLLTEDEREHPAQGFWGNESETYHVNTDGIWCVQSPDLDATGGRPTKVSALPDTSTRLRDESCVDIDVSACED